MSNTLNLNTLQAKVPFNTFVVKIASRCNLNCSYCYMYNLQDHTYKNQPSVMPDQVAIALGQKISSHANRQGIPCVHIILHGGEPLLIGKSGFLKWMKLVRGNLEQCSVTPFFSMQSNGVLLDDEWIELLADQNVRIGISVDGPKEWHDRYRLDHRHRGSFDAVVASIRRLQNHPRGSSIFSNVMAVVNTNIPPVELFNFWQFLGVSGFDLSLPHANHTHPPPKGTSSYGAWLIEFFDLWFDANQQDRHIRYFDNMLRLLFGYPMSTDNIGGRPVGVVVVETDGGIEPTDAFKCCEDGLTKLGLNITRNEFDDLYSHTIVSTLQNGIPLLCATCQGCRVRDVCGGGYMPHRFRVGNGFDNPSVYCEDLFNLITHIRERVVQELPPRFFSSRPE